MNSIIPRRAESTNSSKETFRARAEWNSAHHVRGAGPTRGSDPPRHPPSTSMTYTNEVTLAVPSRTSLGPENEQGAVFLFFFSPENLPPPSKKNEAKLLLVSNKFGRQELHTAYTYHLPSLSLFPLRPSGPPNQCGMA